QPRRREQNGGDDDAYGDDQRGCKRQVKGKSKKRAQRNVGRSNDRVVAQQFGVERKAARRLFDGAVVGAPFPNRGASNGKEETGPNSGVVFEIMPADHEDATHRGGKEVDDDPDTDVTKLVG